MQRLIAYVRVSRVGDREEIRSPEIQERAIRAYCDAHGFEVVEVVVDLDSSGAKVGRKKLRAIIDRILSREVDGIAVFNLDRLARLAPKDRGALLDEIESAGGVIASSTEGHDWSTPEARFVREIFLAVARLEWERKAGGFEVAKEDAVARGVHVSGTVPFGYVRGSDKKLDLDIETAPLVRHAFQLRARGASLGDVQRYLEESTGQGWYTYRVSRTLRNRVYLGEARQGKFTNPNAHPAVVDEQTFEIVQSLFTVSETPHVTGPKNLLAGIARCESCGYSMERSVSGQKWEVYRCKGRSAKGRCVAVVSVSAPQIESYVWDEVLARMTEQEQGIEFVERTETVEVVSARLMSARAKRTPFEDPEYVALLGVDAAKRALAKIETEVRSLESELAEVARETHATRPKVEEVIARIDELSTLDRREIIAGEVESVIVRRVPRGTPIAERVEIHYRVDGTAPVRPSRGRPKVDGTEYPLGELAA